MKAIHIVFVKLLAVDKLAAVRRVSLIYRAEPTTKKRKTEKLKSKKTDMLRSIGKQSRESG